MPYTSLGLYSDPADRRLIVPKRDPRMGWTINLAHPAGSLLLLALGAVTGAAIMFAALRA